MQIQTSLTEAGETAKTQNRLANLIIAGVNKAATTSLYTYLAGHPEVCGSSIKETNYFMPVAYGKPLPALETSAEYFHSSGERRYRMEASPRYIFGGGKLAETIRQNLGPVRIIFVLRQPITRLVSYFNHVKNSGELPKEASCDEYVGRALAELPGAMDRAKGKPVDVYRESVFLRGLAQGFYTDYLEEWYSVFPDTIRIYFFESLTKDPGSVMEDLCTWLEIDPSVYRNSEFSWENRTMKHRSRKIQLIGDFINKKWEPFWRRHTKIKSFARDIYCRINEKHSDDGQLSPARRADLEKVYGPYNQKLKRMLCQKGYVNLPGWLSKSA